MLLLCPVKGSTGRLVLEASRDVALTSNRRADAMTILPDPCRFDSIPTILLLCCQCSHLPSTPLHPLYPLHMSPEVPLTGVLKGFAGFRCEMFSYAVHAR